VRVYESGSSAEALLDGIDTLIFDCDGVLWTGSQTIHNAAEALRVLRARGKRVRFVTNNSSKSRAQYVAKFRGLGIEAEASEVRCACCVGVGSLSSRVGEARQTTVALKSISPQKWRHRRLP